MYFSVQNFLKGNTHFFTVFSALQHFNFNKIIAVLDHSQTIKTFTLCYPFFLVYGLLRSVNKFVQQLQNLISR